MIISLLVPQGQVKQKNMKWKRLACLQGDSNWIQEFQVHLQMQKSKDWLTGISTENEYVKLAEKIQVMWAEEML